MKNFDALVYTLVQMINSQKPNLLMIFLGRPANYSCNCKKKPYFIY